MSGFFLRLVMWFKFGYPLAKAVAVMVADGIVTHTEAKDAIAQALDTAWPKDEKGFYKAFKVPFFGAK
jgi:hypothetical protein